MKPSEIPQSVRDLAAKCEIRLAPRFAEIDEVSMRCTERVMEAFQEFKVSDSCFAGTTGYGYDDLARRWTRSGRASSARRAPWCVSAL